MTKLAVWQFGPRNLRATAHASWDAMARELPCDVEVELGFVDEEGVLLGAFQRSCDGPTHAIKRGTPGCAVSIGPGTLHLLVAMQHLDGDETKILNRHVRPLLAGLTKATSKPARYFGRDWLDVGGHPIAHVGFAHARATGRTVVEAFVAVRTPFTLHARPSYLGKEPTTLEALAGKLDDEELVRAIAAAYPSHERRGERVVSPSITPLDVTAPDLPWAASIDEAIGPVCAGRDGAGRMRVGGEWMASSDAVRDLEDRIDRKEPIRAAVDAAFTAPHTALFGVRSLESFARALEEAFR